MSIIPRGLAALGYTLNTPEENKFLMQKHELIAEVDVLLGGRAAKNVFLERFQQVLEMIWKEQPILSKRWQVSMV